MREQTRNENTCFLFRRAFGQRDVEGSVTQIAAGACHSEIFVFKGKQDLEKQLVKRLRGWRSPDTKFVVMRDQDAADCHDVKARLVELCRQAGKPETLVRVACRELESFFFGRSCRR